MVLAALQLQRAVRGLLHVLTEPRGGVEAQCWCPALWRAVTRYSPWALAASFRFHAFLKFTQMPSGLERADAYQLVQKCHPAMAPQLRAALQEVRERGMGCRERSPRPPPSPVLPLLRPLNAASPCGGCSGH